MKVNSRDQLKKHVGYELGVSVISTKRVALLHKKDPSYTPSKIPKGISIREYYENEEYPDLPKIRVQALRKLVGLLICLKRELRQQYPDKNGNILMCMIQDLNPNEISQEILEFLEISKRSSYDYLHALKMILDYSSF